MRGEVDVTTLVLSHFATPAPSHVPTLAPSHLPTPALSLLPTPALSHLPTPALSHLPTPALSHLPTRRFDTSLLAVSTPSTRRQSAPHPAPRDVWFFDVDDCAALLVPVW